MYADVRRYRVDPASVDEALHRVDERFCPELEEMPGFVAYEVLDCGDGEILAITVFRTREGAEMSREAAAGWVARDLSDMDIERTDAISGEIKVSRASSEMLEPAHA
jgi:hypothetical protein